MPFFSKLIDINRKCVIYNTPKVPILITKEEDQELSKYVVYPWQHSSLAFGGYFYFYLFGHMILLPRNKRKNEGIGVMP